MSDVLDVEIESLQSIYGADRIEVLYSTGGSVPSSNPTQSATKIASITFQFNANIFILLEIFSNYPESSPHAEMIMNKRISAKSSLDALIATTLEDNRGHECLFQVIEAVKEFLETQGLIDGVGINEAVSDELDLAAVDKRTENISIKESGKPGVEIVENLRIIHGEITKERKSTFQSHLCAVHSMADVDLFRRTVLSDKRVAQATHNILSYRFNGKMQTSGNREHVSTAQALISFHDYDSDGETAAGGKLAEMMRLMSIEGVAVIVSRWFGGVLLGPDRFKLICNSARKLLEENGYGAQQSNDTKTNQATSTAMHKKKS